MQLLHLVSILVAYMQVLQSHLRHHDTPLKTLYYGPQCAVRQFLQLQVTIDLCSNPGDFFQSKLTTGNPAELVIWANGFKELHSIGVQPNTSSLSISRKLHLILRDFVKCRIFYCACSNYKILSDKFPIVFISHIDSFVCLSITNVVTFVLFRRINSQAAPQSLNDFCTAYSSFANTI